MKALIALCLITLFVRAQIISEGVQTSNCVEFFNQKPRRGTAFSKNFDRNVDLRELGGRIVLYRIRWFLGFWSEWFVPDFNDVNWGIGMGPKNNQTNLNTPLMTRAWCYFEDHDHSYVLCK